LLIVNTPPLQGIGCSTLSPVTSSAFFEEMPRNLCSGKLLLTPQSVKPVLRS
jgi:hypothetical protein